MNDWRTQRSHQQARRLRDEGTLRHEQWPADRFYWALLEAPGWSRRGELPASLRLLLAEAVPAPIDTLHAMGVPLDGGKHVLACALPREQLRLLTPDVAALTPMGLPGFVRTDAASIDPRTLNLLVGSAEPRPIRASRHRRHAMGAAAFAICSLLIGVGLHRRAETDQMVARTAAQELARLAPPADAASADGWAAGDALDMELARLRSLHRAAARASPAADAVAALAALLSAWPVDTSATAHSIAVHDTGATLAVSVADDPAVFIGALRLPAGWTMREPRLNRAHDRTRINLELVRPVGDTTSPAAHSSRAASHATISTPPLSYARNVEEMP